MSRDSVRALAPATVANLGSGFDLMGLAIEQVADEVIITKTNHPGLVIEEISGDNGLLPKAPEENTCTVAIQSLLKKLQRDDGFEIKITKRVAINSGLGSSASSAVAGVVGVNELLGKPFSKNDLISFALDGEYVASKGFHADNIAPCMLGGITFITEMNPLTIQQLKFSEDVHLVVLYQYIKVSTAEAREILPKQYDRKVLTRQSARIASLISGILNNDETSLRFGLEDELATPHRKNLIPYFDSLNDVALENEATGFNISGSGPSVFAWCKDESTANAVCLNWKKFMQKENKPFEIYVSKINKEGVRIS